MAIDVGDRLPEASLQRLGADGIEQVDLRSLAAGRKLALFAVPGAFTPTCSETHLPGFVDRFDDFKAKGVDVACVSVNDPFVMQAWGDAQRVPAGLAMLADGNGAFTRALGLELDATGYGMGLRSKRYSLCAEDGVVRMLNVEAPGEFRVSSADYLLSRLP